MNRPLLAMRIRRGGFRKADARLIFHSIGSKMPASKKIAEFALTVGMSNNDMIEKAIVWLAFGVTCSPSHAAGRP